MEKKEILLSNIENWEMLGKCAGIPFYEEMFAETDANSKTALTDILKKEIQEVIAAFQEEILSEDDFRMHKKMYIRNVEAIIFHEDFPLELRRELRNCFAPFCRKLPSI